MNSQVTLTETTTNQTLHEDIYKLDVSNHLAECDVGGKCIDDK